jgi:hypothetical protein
VSLIFYPYPRQGAVIGGGNVTSHDGKLPSVVNQLNTRHSRAFNLQHAAQRQQEED